MDGLLAQIVRSDVVESEHRGYLVVLGADGSVIKEIGDRNALIYPRSSVKPLQSAAMVKMGLDLEPRLLALATASHNGSPEHQSAVLEILKLAKLDEKALRCIPDRPIGEIDRRNWADKEPTRLAMNCSGKHSAMILTSVINGWPVESYLDPNHPLQVGIKAEFEKLTEEKMAKTSVDGCGAPLFLMTVHGMAKAIRTLTISSDPDYRRVIESMRAFPHMVAGEGRYSTTLMREIPGLAMKEGAEAVNVASLPDGRTFVFKISDGSQRPFRTLIYACLDLLGVKNDFAGEMVLGGGKPIGAIRATF